MSKTRLILILTCTALGYAAFSILHQDNMPIPVQTNKTIPSDWGFIQRTYPFYQADKSVYKDALEVIAEKRRSQQSSSKNRSISTWVFEGPSNVGGRIVDIEFDPLRPDTVYAGAAAGGVLKSIDRGITWEPIFDEQSILTIGDIAIDPHDSDILYVGTGEANGGHNNFAGGGVYRSVDAGQTWHYSGLLETASIGRVVVDHTTPNRVFVAAAGSYFGPDPDRGVYRSDDGGGSWQKVLFVNDSTGVIDVAQKPDDGSVLLATSWERVRRPEGSVFLYGNGSGIHRSEDGGDTWFELGVSDGLPDPATLQDGTGRATIGRIGLSFSQSSPNIAYALYTDGSAYLGLYKSIDGGNTWGDADPGKQLQSVSAGFSWYFGQVRVHPENPDQLYVMDVLVARSENAGSSWTMSSGTHVDYHAMAFDPSDPDRVLAGNDGGIAISTSAGASWIAAQDLPITQFYEINYDASNPARIVGGTQDNGTWLKTDTAWIKILGGDGFYAILDPTDPNVIYAESQNGILSRSTNGGATFLSARTGIPSGEKRNWSTPVILDPSNSDVLYYGTDKLYRSTNQAASWSAISPVLTGSAPGARLGSLTTIAVAPADSNTVYVGTDDGKVWTTRNYGNTWTDITSGLPLRWVTRVDVSASDPEVAFVTFSGLKWRDPQPHIFRTRNGGATWQDISSDLPDLPINALAVDAADDDVIYVGTDIGAFVTEDGGATWSILGDGLPAVPVYDLKHISTTKELLAGTHGRSAYRLDVAAYTTNTEDLPLASPATLSAFPNPFLESITIELPASDQPMTVSVYDVVGRQVWKAENLATPRVTWTLGDASSASLPSGVYLIRVTETDKPGNVIAHGSVLRIR